MELAGRKSPLRAAGLVTLLSAANRCLNGHRFEIQTIPPKAAHPHTASPPFVLASSLNASFPSIEIMSYQVLARKWRPIRLNKVVGQQHVLTALTNALDRGGFTMPTS